jgi:dihydroceramide fatty acyl 2-hydroxylase
MAAPSTPVDLEQPILAQVGAIGEGYDAWVHRSIKPKGSLRIFHNSVLEALSHIPWWLVLVVWVPVTIALFLAAVVGQNLPLGRAMWLAAVGFLAWTLLEYVLHRWIFHYKVSTPFGRKLHFLAHGIHHLDPWDRTRLVFPPLAAAGIAVVVFLAIYLAVSWTSAPLPTAMAVMSGLLVGYLVYDMTHYYTHHAKPKSRWGKYLKRYHLEHHHKHPERLFGVSSPLWDVVFGTARPRV